MHIGRLTLTIAAAAALTACAGGGSKPIQTATAGDKQVSLSTASGTLANGNNDVTVSFTDASGKPVDVQSPALTFRMPAMGSMAEMKSDASLTPAGQPGVFKGTVDLGMKGMWQTAVSFQDASGSHRVTFDVQAQ